MLSRSTLRSTFLGWLLLRMFLRMYVLMHSLPTEVITCDESHAQKEKCHSRGTRFKKPETQSTPLDNPVDHSPPAWRRAVGPLERPEQGPASALDCESHISHAFMRWTPTRLSHSHKACEACARIRCQWPSARPRRNPEMLPSSPTGPEATRAHTPTTSVTHGSQPKSVKTKN